MKCGLRGEVPTFWNFASDRSVVGKHKRLQRQPIGASCCCCVRKYWDWLHSWHLPVTKCIWNAFLTNWDISLRHNCSHSIVGLVDQWPDFMLLSEDAECIWQIARMRILRIWNNDWFTPLIVDCLFYPSWPVITSKIVPMSYTHHFYLIFNVSICTSHFLRHLKCHIMFYMFLPFSPNTQELSHLTHVLRSPIYIWNLHISWNISCSHGAWCANWQDVPKKSNTLQKEKEKVKDDCF